MMLGGVVDALYGIPRTRIAPRERLYLAHLRIAGCGGAAASRRSSSWRRNMPVWVSICPTTEAELIVAARSASSMGFPSIT